MRKKLFVLFSVMIVGAMLLSACAPGAGADVKAPVTLHWNFQTEPPTLDPTKSLDNVSNLYIGNIFSGLVELGKEHSR